jgi:ribonuclease H / adenosylcobalamin/alpha-ribazole phosphatase
MIGLLIRHGHTDAVGQWLAGRQRGVWLSATGRLEATALMQALMWAPLTAVYSSPLERAVETATPLADDHGLRVRTSDALTEVDFGDWTGRAIMDLAHDPGWQSFNQSRARARPPRGEAIADVQRRIVEMLLALSLGHPGEIVACVTHAELIRCAVAAFRGTTLDDVMGIEISPGRVTPVGLTAAVRRVFAIDVPPAALTV